MFEIEDNVAFPTPHRRHVKYPFGEMEVGQSFLVAEEDSGKVQIAASAYAKRHQKRFATRSVDGGRRVWRIA